ncbi:ABC transporter substrate-binding protein [Pelagovum sp. HNIBRBA483]|uniref:ABC transporter substrate-binding protein n=1 Tax=Pelagovum sp. HNIBRBA483 TaxID=3233341 RepID=UPI0034A2D1FB
MTHETKKLHHAAYMYADEVKRGELSRREFLTRTTALGVTTAAAYGLLGLEAPVQAAAHAQMGGVLRIQQEVRPLKDPRTWDWTQISNFCRGWLEYLVETQTDGSVRPMLLESWDVNDDATQYVLNVRQGVMWNNGEELNAEHIAWLINYWCDSGVEGNSMATRMGSLIDPDTGVARDGAIEVTGSHSVTLNLPNPDITIIPGMADYPAAVIHPSTNLDDIMSTPVGTGAYLPTEMEVGVKGTLVKNADHEYWGNSVDGYNGAYVDSIEFIDYGTDPSSWLAAIESDEVDLLYQNVNEFIDIADAIGWEKSEVVTGATVVVRFNQQTEVDGKAIYADHRVRQAISQSVDNSVVLELGYNGRGVQADNHHVAPVHPEYADIGRPKYDPDGAAALMAEAGMADYEFELITLDDGFNKNTGDAVAAQVRDAGINIKRTVLPGSTFWNDWAKYPFSATEWNHRPLGVQVLALAYKSGVPWNEAGYANPEFDALLDKAFSIADADTRREVMREIETIFQNDAVIIQSYWRSLYRHYRPGMFGADMHPAFEIHVHKIGYSA